MAKRGRGERTAGVVIMNFPLDDEKDVVKVDVERVLDVVVVVERESRALWFKVAKGIRESDFKTAAREKSRIEVCNFPTVHIFLPLLTRSMTHFYTLSANRMTSVRDSATK